MKRTICILFAVLLFCLSLGCAPEGNVYEHPRFTAVLPDGFQHVDNANIVCFAPNGDPTRSSSITFYATELNWYFDEYDAADYETILADYTSYTDYEFVGYEEVKVDHYNARRAEYSVELDQGTHSLVLYAIEADKTYFFVLLNLDTDFYIDEFDEMMRTISINEQ